MTPPAPIPRRLRLLPVAALALAAAGCGTGAALQTEVPPRLQSSAVIWACGQRAVVRPRSLIIGCADGNTELSDLRWRDWGAETATARGRIAYNRCVPDCAAGRFASAPIDVRVSNLVIGTDHAAYATVTMIGRVVSPHHLTYPLQTSGPGGRS